MQTLTDLLTAAAAFGGFAVGVWVAFRLERIAGRVDSVQEDVRTHVNAPGLHAR